MSKLKVGDIVSIYSDYQNQTGFLGKAKLIKFLTKGLSFIIKDAQSEATTVNYNSERWLIEVIRSNYYSKGYIKSHNIRFLEHIGLAKTSNSKEYIDEENFNEEDEENYLKHYKSIDNFLIVNEIQCF